MSEPDAKRAKVEDGAKAAGDVKAENTTKKALEEIDKVQTEIDSLNEQASEEILKVEQRFNLLRKPHYDKRNELIKNIPNFWVTTFINHPQISRTVTAHEEACLRFLTTLEVEEYEDIKSGYRMKFFFDPNPYFENTEIVKEFQLSSAEPTNVTTEIKWKPGKKLYTMEEVGSKLIQVRKSERRGFEFLIGKDRVMTSFFDWLVSNVDPISDDMAEVIKDDVWPNPIQYYLIPDLEGDDEDEDGLDDDDELGDPLDEALDEIDEENGDEEKDEENDGEEH